MDDTTSRPASRALSTVLLGAITALALLLPSRVIGPLDGAPIDSPEEVALLGVLFPALLVLRPRFLTRRIAMISVGALLAWKVLAAAALVQGGWCLRFESDQPLTRSGVHVPHAWDVRADWRNAVPTCSAIMSRSYFELADFPVWFFNLPPATFHPPSAADRPPGARIRAHLSGVVTTSSAGVLTLNTGPDMSVLAHVDGEAAPHVSRGVHLAAGSHRIDVAMELSGNQWRLDPQWEGRPLLANEMATVSEPSFVGRVAHRWLGSVNAIFVVSLLGAWSLAVWRTTPRVLALACVGLTAVMSVSMLSGVPLLMRAAPMASLVVLLLRRRELLASVRAAMLVVALPWVFAMAAYALPESGKITMYSGGDDWWTFQRFAYRIYLEGYWLEGGQVTFWFQPLYRWIAGALHMVFGDSSVGERLWDVAAVAACALLSHAVVLKVAGVRPALVAAIICVATFTLGPAWYLIGRGLSELTSAGFLALAAYAALRVREGSHVALFAVALLPVLAFYTRLNNLPAALAVAAFALPMSVSIADAWRWRTWRAEASMPLVLAVVGGVAIGIYLFALRTWHYTGVFDMFHGTQAGHLSVWQDDPATMVARLRESLLVVATMTDPPHADWRALPLWIGLVVATLGLVGLPFFRRMPAAPVISLLSGLVTAVVARGTAYPGRFSVHLIALATALTLCAVSFGATRLRRSSGNARMFAARQAPS